MTTATHTALLASVQNTELPGYRESSKYELISSKALVEQMEDSGYRIVSQQQRKKRNPLHQPFAQHVIRFRHVDAQPEHPNLGYIIPEMVVRNSHDCTTALTMFVGFFRVVCSNGLVSGDIRQRTRVLHRGAHVHEQIATLMQQTLEQTERTRDAFSRWSVQYLTTRQQHALAAEAVKARWDTPPHIDFSMLLHPTRPEDAEPTLWNTYNILQERIAKGGFTTEPVNDKKGRRMSAIRSAIGNLEFNTSLSAAVERFSQSL